ncbi:MAG: tyrosine-type recombinase/integrase [Pseudomonadota bacterium]
MPKGIPKSITLPTADDDVVMAVGATHFPPEGGAPAVPLPRGVAIRSSRGVQIEFSLDGRQTRTIRGVPTVAAVKAAVRLRAAVITAIDHGAGPETIAQMLSGGRPQRDVPRDKRSAARGSIEDATTVGIALDEWLVIRWPALAPNTRKDYVGRISRVFKPLDISAFGLKDSCFVAGAHSGPQPATDGFWKEQPEGITESGWWPTSTIPRERVLEEIPLEPGEKPSTRRRRRLTEWRLAGCHGPAPTTTKSIWRERALVLPLQCLGQLRVHFLSDVLAGSLCAVWINSGLSVKTVKNFVGQLNLAMERLVAQNKLAHNPFRAVVVGDAELRTPRSKRADVARVEFDGVIDDGALPDPGFDEGVELESEEGAPDPFTAQEMLAILEQFKGAMRNQVIFLFMTGVRTGEMIALRVSCYDRDGSRIRIILSQSRGVLGKTKTGKARWVYLNPQAKAAVEAQLALFGAPGGWIFPNPHTLQQWRGTNKQTARWAKALEAAGVRYRRPYHTRHTYATLMLLAGESLMYVSKQLGHADWHMVQQRYARFIESAQTRKPGAAMAEVHSETLERLGTMLAPDSAPADDETDD